jgi:phosphatidylserine decarboxylase
MSTRKEGRPFILSTIGACFLAGLAGWYFISTLFVVLALFFVLFFRDPQRDIPPLKEAVLSPADGKVVVVRDDQDGMHLAIFMSLFDCHVNRAPLEGEVVDVRRESGGFKSANLPDASKNNRVIITFKGENGEVFRVSLIAGMVARRIKSWVSVGDKVRRGEKIGMILFGSRVEVDMPANLCNFVVREGEKVKAGESIIGMMED